MSVISAAQANQLNCLVRKEIDNRLFLTCNYTPTEVPVLGSSAKFYLGIQDLYKFTVDTSFIICNLNKYLPVDTEQSFIRACLKSFDKRRWEADNKEKQAGVGENASISK